jgi:hypothetical protein
MSGYTKKDASEDTDSGGKETSRAWHQAREDARDSGEIYDRSDKDDSSDKDDKKK